MALTSIAKLQKDYDSLRKKYIRQTDLLAERREKYNSLQKKYDYLEKNIEEKIKTAVASVNDDLIKENEELKLEIERLKKLLNLDSNNSGIPTSHTPMNKEKRIPNTREKSNKTKGGQIGHSKHKLERFNDEEITDVYVHKVVKCDCGCSKLKDLGIRTTKDNYDISIRVQKIRNEFHNYQCACCGKVIESPVPLNLKEENQYGNNIKALVVSLVNEGCVSFNRVRKLISGFTNNEIEMSEGYIAKLQKKCYENLAGFLSDLKIKILNEPIVHWDDTGLQVDTKKSCLRYYGTKNLALYTAHEKKNKAGLDEDGILNNLTEKTTVVHDHNTINYNDDYDFENAECCVHLIRDLKSLAENLNHEWPNKIINLLVETNKERKRYIEDNLYFENKYIDEVQNKYDEILLEAKEANKSDFNKYYGTDEKRLINRMIKYKANYLMWVVRFDVPFDNNLSERSLRMAKTKMKVSGQFANIKNAEYYAAIRSYIETCKRNDVNEHIALVKLFEGKPYTIEEILKSSDNN